MLDSEIKAFLPLRGLTRVGGAPAGDSLCVPSHGVGAKLAGLRMLWRYGDVLSISGDLLVVISTALVAISSETVGLKLRGSCEMGGSIQGCFVTVATFAGPARAAEGLLAAVLVLIGVVAVVLMRWRSGVATHPGSVAAVCALLQNPETRGVMRSVRILSKKGDQKEGDQEVARQLEGKRFALG